MSHGLIRQLFEQKLYEWADENDVEVVSENSPFDPHVMNRNEAYVVSTLKPISTPALTLSGDHTGYLGIYQMSIVTGLGYGVARANQLAQSLREIFPIYQPVVEGSFKVIPISHVQLMEVSIGDAASTLPVFFRYRADTN